MLIKMYITFAARGKGETCLGAGGIPGPNARPAPAGRIGPLALNAAMVQD